MGAAAVDRYYRVAFTDERSFRIWRERIVEFAALVRDIIVDRGELRPVIFVPLHPVEGEPPLAYVSAGARGLAARISSGATVDAKPVNVADLPHGLTMLFGDEVDTADYEERHK